MRKEIIVDVLAIIGFLLIAALSIWMLIDHCSENSALYEFTTTNIDWCETLRIVFSTIAFVFGVAMAFGGVVLMGIFTYDDLKK